MALDTKKELPIFSTLGNVILVQFPQARVTKKMFIDEMNKISDETNRHCSREYMIFD